jgi:hypothetical protein
MADAKALLQKAQTQTQANRYAFLIRQLNAKLTNNIRNSK